MSTDLNICKLQYQVSEHYFFGNEDFPLRRCCRLRLLGTPSRSKGKGRPSSYFFFWPRFQWTELLFRKWSCAFCEELELLRTNVRVKLSLDKTPTFHERSPNIRETVPSLIQSYLTKTATQISRPWDFRRHYCHSKYKYSYSNVAPR